MQRLFWIILFRLLGWDTRAHFPSGIKKCVIIAGPHTHWMDFPVGLAYRSIMRLNAAHYLAKKELFDGPFGFFFRWAGGIPVDRFSKHNVVDQVVDILSAHTDMMIALSPEGTRKKVDRLRTGFYYIAKKAGIPIVMVGFDFLNRRVLVSAPFYTSDSPKADFDRILNFFAPIQGKIPSQGFAGISNQFE
ncbi:MAG: 1-acyl-sn-glycerol-3-phosphate acyltransferase [Sphingomonadales bacterium]|nr:acyltransferase [Sphingomonadales bacterium]